MDLQKDYGNIHERNICAIVITSDGKYLYTKDAWRSLKCWNIEKNKLVQEWITGFGHDDDYEERELEVSRDGKY